MKSVLCYKRLCGMFYYTTLWCLFAGYLMHIFIFISFHFRFQSLKSICVLFLFQTSVIIFNFNN